MHNLYEPGNPGFESNEDEDESEDEFETIEIFDENNKAFRVIILDKVTENGVQYLLVSDEEEYRNSDEPSVFILKQNPTQKLDAQEDFLTFSAVEDDEELSAIGELFGLL